jgi:hypothetical protein
VLVVCDLFERGPMLLKSSEIVADLGGYLCLMRRRVSKYLGRTRKTVGAAGRLQRMARSAGGDLIGVFPSGCDGEEGFAKLYRATTACDHGNINGAT